MKQPLIVNLNGKDIQYRKWKGKDKKRFLNSLQYGEQITLKNTIEILIHEQLLSNQTETFTQNEYRYLLSKIRGSSLGSEFNIDLVCEECEEIFNYEFDLDDVIKPIHEDLEDYDDGELQIKFGKIKNREMYLEAIDEDPEYEILFRIDELNESKDFTLETLIDFFDEMDLDKVQQVQDHYEQGRFKINDIETVKCPHCQEEMEIMFDEIPGFFPDSWFEEAFKDLLQEYHEQEIKEMMENRNMEVE